MTSQALQDLLRLCWHRNPFVRPSFSKIVWDMKQLRAIAGATPFADDTVSPPILTPERPPRPSPDMRPTPLPIFRTCLNVAVTLQNRLSFDLASTPSAPDGVSSPSDDYHSAPLSPLSDTYLPKPGDVHAVHPVMFTPSINASRSSSIFTSVPESASDEGVTFPDYEGYDSPPPANERLAELRSERRYRMLLNHDFHPSCES